ncbi:DUF4440 domain-containing protein [Hymenobacter busanensis]|uniref:DUF4440 domain-containing protein n=1 Tax=Hymenobacter busanensis TaxID=2607656 RepID=UPI0013672868|nr:nuclear transport factor 2 family protein [Hymenobacter busanensis]QHJ07253.1 DUF4440 domain-containing protein [Hymenobacter busanensis]
MRFYSFRRRAAGLFVAAVAGLGTAQAQIPKQRHVEAIQAQSVVWNRAFNGRDSTAFYALFSSRANLCGANGCQTTPAEVRRTMRTLWRTRPDITWMNRSQQVQVNDQSLVACENGEWTESFTHKQAPGKSQITGRYWLMWGFEDGQWRILSGIFTPLTCTGNYCRE